MEWIKFTDSSRPKENKEYLCVVVIPSAQGKYRTKVMSLYYNYQWCCEDMIVVYWTEIPEIPKEIVLWID